LFLEAVCAYEGRRLTDLQIALHNIRPLLAEDIDRAAHLLNAAKMSLMFRNGKAEKFLAEFESDYLKKSGSLELNTFFGLKSVG
jgi:hypothetical protein